MSTATLPPRNAAGKRQSQEGHAEGIHYQPHHDGGMVCRTGHSLRDATEEYAAAIGGTVESIERNYGQVLKDRLYYQVWAA